MEAKIKKAKDLLKKYEKAEIKLERTTRKFRPVQEKVLERFQLKSEDGEIIYDIEDLCDCVEEDRLDLFFDELHKEYIKAGAKIKESGYCPICIAECELTTARQNFAIAAMEALKVIKPESFGELNSGALYRNYNNFIRFVEISRKYFSQELNIEINN